MVTARLGLAALLAVSCAHIACAQPPSVVPAISIELVKCREARILVRQAQDLVLVLTQLGLAEAQATDYLAKLKQQVDQCETTTGNTVPQAPPFPTPSLSVGRPEGRLVERTPGPRSAFAANAPTYVNRAIFLDSLVGYSYALAAQCGASFALAWIAPTRPLFDRGVDVASFGKCTKGGNRGTSKGDLPKRPSLSSSETQCAADVVAALQNLATDQCRGNPRAEGASPPPPLPDEWYRNNKKSETIEPTPNGGTKKTTTYEGTGPGGQKVTITITETRDANRKLEETKEERTTKFQDGAVGKTTTVTDDIGVISTHTEELTASDGRKVWTRNCDPECHAPIYGPAWEELQRDLEAAREKVEVLGAVYHASETVLKFAITIAEHILIGRFLPHQCVHFPGADTKLHYKDDKGEPFDVAQMVHQCTCKARAERCPLCSGGFHATSCESTKEAKRRECLQNPFGPIDEVRKECVELLQADNPSVNIEALICRNITCSRNTVRKVSFSANKHLTCGCFSPSGLAPDMSAAQFCSRAICETGSCRCQNEGGLRTCGCVSSDVRPSLPPLDLGPPISPPTPPH
jgi:hypothetical protein